MDLYFVRHGATASNVMKRFQKPNEPVTDAGSRGVARLVRRVYELEPTHLYTSHYKRARDTAHYLSYSTGLEAQWLEEVCELGYPEQLLGQRHYTLHTALYGIRWLLGHSSITALPGAETRADFFARIKAAQQYFASEHTPDDRIVIVSHSVFINGFITHMCRERPAGWSLVPRYVFRVLRSKNTGITHVRFDEREGDCGWSVVGRDDSSHLRD